MKHEKPTTGHRRSCVVALMSSSDRFRVQGVIFVKAIGAYDAILHLDLEEEEALAIVKIQFPDSQVSETEKVTTI